METVRRSLSESEPRLFFHNDMTSRSSAKTLKSTLRWSRELIEYDGTFTTRIRIQQRMRGKACRSLVKETSTHQVSSFQSFGTAKFKVHSISKAKIFA